MIDIPHAEDVRLYAPILVGARTKPASISQVTLTQAQQPQVAPPSDAPKTPEPAKTESILKPPSVLSSDTKEDSDSEKAIIQILSDGSSKELIVISTELQLKNQGFLDLNQVKKLCEDMVSQGKLRRTTEGEFFAKHALNTALQ